MATYHSKPRTDGSHGPLTVSSDDRHTIVLHLKKHKVKVKRTYHDRAVVKLAPIYLKFQNGQVTVVSTDDQGEAELETTDKPTQVAFGPDGRDYQPVDQAKNPDHVDTPNPEAIVQKAEANPNGTTPERKSVGYEVANWIWGVIEGGFDEQQSVSQAMVELVIGLIPLVGDVAGARDLIAEVLKLADHPEKRGELLEWVTLVLLLLALIPVFGGAIKGIGKLVMDSALKGGHGELVVNIVRWLNRLGEGNAVKFLRELDFTKYTAEIQKLLKKLGQSATDILETFLTRAKALLRSAPASVTGVAKTAVNWTVRMVERLEKLKAQLGKLIEESDAWIPRVLKFLDRRFKGLMERLSAAQHRLYEGNWNRIPDSLHLHAAEPEATIVRGIDDETGRAADYYVGNPKGWEHPPTQEFHREPGWPDFSDPAEKKSWIVPTFSGPIKAQKIPPGTVLRRVVTQQSNKAGAFWCYAHDFPKDGTAWRKNWAVLDQFSKNGFYVELTVPKPGLWVWEGRTATQLDEASGQLLAGGAIQLAIDFDFAANHAVKAAVDNLPRLKTNWTAKSLDLVGHPKSAIKVEVLGDAEIKSKKIEAFAAKSGLVGSAVGVYVAYASGPQSGAATR